MKNTPSVELRIFKSRNICLHMFVILLEKEKKYIKKEEI